MARRTTRRRRTASGSLGIPGLKLPRGVPTLVRGVGRLFKGSKKSAGANAAPRGSAWIWVVLGLAFAAWVAWDALGSRRNGIAAETRAESAEFTEVSGKARSSNASPPEPANPEPAKPKPSNTSKPPAWKDGDWVRGDVVVTKVLPDDLDPPRHQRFLASDAWGRTFLFAHNIDVARRVENLAPGDEIRFRGEYKLKGQGGVIHWTHAPASGRGQGGWIERAGVTYR
ncbi:MAG: DUF3465 domain-containing protein [Kiritimatiellae bacterium]|nr:DUF3465 domain-containing protein [Kiritimatiellia bacterium]